MRPPTDLFRQDAGSDAGPCDPLAPPSISRAVVTVRTSTLSGRYAPRNVGAIWIENGDGRFVRTLEQWGIRRRRYLTTFLASSVGNVIDAVTSATLPRHVTHTATWDLRDARRCLVEQGEYRVDFELTERNGAGAFAFYPFTLPATPEVLDLVETANFHDVQITFE